MSEDKDRCFSTLVRWFSGHFRQVFFNTIAFPRINIGAGVWGKSIIMTGFY
jgi:hypothetical protein